MRAGRQAPFADINITPLTDIFLVLLIIMMVVAPLLDYRGLDMFVSVGKPSDAKPSKDESKQLWVSIAPDGQYNIGGKTISFEDLSGVIRDSAVDKPDGVVIEVNPDTTHGFLAHAMDAVQACGIAKLSVVEAAPPKKGK